jgi:hypothetical protein
MRELLLFHDPSIDVTVDHPCMSMSQEEWYMQSDSDREKLRSVIPRGDAVDIVAWAVRAIRVELASWRRRGWWQF